MSESNGSAVNEYAEETGGFADLGLESSDIQVPTFGVGVGTHKGFVSNMRFLRDPTGTKGRQLVITYKCVQESNPYNGQTKDEWKSANPNDSADVKKWLKGRLVDLGVTPEQMPTLDIKSLIGTPVYFKIAESKGYMNVRQVELDTDGDFNPMESTAGESSAKHSAVSAGALDY